MLFFVISINSLTTLNQVDLLRKNQQIYLCKPSLVDLASGSVRRPKEHELGNASTYRSATQTYGDEIVYTNDFSTLVFSATLRGGRNRQTTLLLRLFDPGSDRVPPRHKQPLEQLTCP